MEPRRRKEGSPRWLSALFFAVGLGFAAAGLFHAAAIAFPEIAEPSPAWRHGLFVAVNGFVAVGLLRRPRWFAWVLTALTLQQLYSHGTYGWHVWSVEGRVDWASVLVLAVLPALTALFYWDVRQRREVREPKRGT